MHYLLVNFDNNGDISCSLLCLLHSKPWSSLLCPAIIEAHYNKYAIYQSSVVSYNYKMASENTTKLNLGWMGLLLYSVMQAKWLKVTNLNMIYESQQQTMRTFVCF